MRTLTSVFIVSMAAVTAADFSNPAGATDFSSVFRQQNRLMPNFSNGFLVSLPFQPGSPEAAAVLIADSSGFVKKVPVPRLEGAVKIQLFAAAASRAQDLAVTGSMLDREGRFVSFLAVMADGKTTLVRTNPYSAERVTFAPDGSVWISVVRGDEGGGDDPRAGDFPVLRHYSRTGALLGTALPRSTLTGLNPGESTGGEGLTELVSNKASIGFFVGTSKRWYSTDAQGEWVATPFTSTGQYVMGVAYLDNGSVYTHQVTPGNSEMGLYRLDPSKGEWVPVPGSERDERGDCRVCSILGAHGDQVVYMGGNASGQLKWLAPGN